MEHDVPVVSDRSRYQFYKSPLLVDAEKDVLRFPVVPFPAKPFERIAPCVLDGIVVKAVLVGVGMYCD